VVEGGFVVVAGVVIMSEYDVYFTGNVMGLLGEKQYCLCIFIICLVFICVV